jgi:hypothetical protein
MSCIQKGLLKRLLTCYGFADDRDMCESGEVFQREMSSPFL